MPSPSDAGPRLSRQIAAVGPWFARTRMGRWKDRSSIAIIIAILLFCLWESFF